MTELKRLRHLCWEAWEEVYGSELGGRLQAAAVSQEPDPMDLVEGLRQERDALAAVLEKRGHRGLSCPKSASYMGDETDSSTCNCGVDDSINILTVHDAQARKPLEKEIEQLKGVVELRTESNIDLAARLAEAKEEVRRLEKLAVGLGGDVENRDARIAELTAKVLRCEEGLRADSLHAENRRLRALCGEAREILEEHQKLWRNIDKRLRAASKGEQQ